jgi:hypothetical protein
VDSLQKLCSSLEPILRRVVRLIFNEITNPLPHFVLASVDALF